MSAVLYSIQKDKFTFYLKCNYTGIEFGLIGFTMDGVEGFFMKDFSIYSDDKVEGHPCISLSDHLFARLKTEADAELKVYLDKNITDYSIYISSNTDFKDIWRYAGKEPQHRIDRELDCSRILDGIVGLVVNNYLATYSFAVSKFIGLRPRYRDEPVSVTPMTVLYDDVLARMLAHEQYSRGVAPPMYHEMVRLSTFLAEKKSLKIVMKDGTVHELKPRRGEIYLSSLLECAGSRFVLNDNCSITPRLGRNEPLPSLDYLQYGRNQFVIDAEALNTFKL